MPAPTIGSRIGPYELLDSIGAGGMGEVWKARDTRVDRIVAVKFSKSQFSERFEREARAIAALNHPNICSLYDVGPDYLVMEFVEGSPVSPPGDIRKLLDVALQIADGLAAAHAGGVIHRDLKPDNILITREGRVKILDFGLAKQAAAASASPSESTRTMGITNPGTILGTVAYMSPEQARGQELDAKSDQFSFGLILYELATGKRAFQRETSVETMAAIIREVPEPLPASVPAPLRWVVERCLTKDSDGRYDTTRGLYLDLRAMRERSSETLSSSVFAPDIAAPRRKTVPLWAALVLGLAAVVCGTAGMWVLTTRRATTPAVPKYTPFATEACDERQPAWSPDGRSLAYVCTVDGVGQVFVRALDSVQAAKITQGTTNALRPFWSPDGTRIYFEQGPDLYFTSASGGTPQLFLSDAVQGASSPDGKRLMFFRRSNSSIWLANADGSAAVQYKGKSFPETIRSGSGKFSPDGTRLAIVTLNRSGDQDVRQVWIVPSDGGDPVRSPMRLKDYALLPTPSWSRDGRHLMVSARNEASADDAHLFRLNVTTGEMQQLTSGPAAEGEHSMSPDGKRVATVVTSRNEDIFEFSLETGHGQPVIAGSRDDFAGVWAPSGREFTYVSDVGGRLLVWFRGESGPSRPLTLSGPEVHNVRDLAISPDGQRLALDSYGVKHRTMLVSTAGGVPIELDPGNPDTHNGAFSPDGAWIAYTRFSQGQGYIAKISSAGGGHAVDILGVGRGPGFPVRWSPAGDWIAYSDMDRRELRLVSPDGKAQKTLIRSVSPFWAFDRSGAHIIGIRRDADRRWEAWSVDVATGAEKKIVTLDVSPQLELNRMSLHPEGKRLLVTVANISSDIWMVEGVEN